MKILVLSEYIENYQDKASFKIRYKTALKMSEKGHHVVFMSPSKELFHARSINVTENFKVVTTIGLLPARLRSGGFSILDALCKSMMILKCRFDVIHVTNGHRPAQLLPCLLGKYLRNCIIVDECWEWLGEGGYAAKRTGGFGKIVALYDRFFELRFKTFYNHIITISTALKKRFKKQENVTVFYGGMENEDLKNHTIEWARNKHQLPQDAFIIGMSNLTSSDHNDNDIFFKAFEKLSREYNNLYLLATGTDAQYIKKIKREYSFQDRIFFSGWIDFESYSSYLCACNVFVMPYSNTAINVGRWPNKVGDYLCLERPVITNPTGDIQVLFEKYKLGFMCEETAEGFYKIVKKILDEKMVRKYCCSDAHYVANEILSFDGRIDHILKLFEAIYEPTNTKT